jgi:hypothetical protein
MHREFHVVHGRGGWQLSIRDEPWAGLVMEPVIEGLLAALGHPCCDRGALSRLRVSYRTLRRLHIPFGADVELEDDELDDNALSLLWFRVLSLPNRFSRRSHQVLGLPLTREQAHVLAPRLVEDREARDEEGT